MLIFRQAVSRDIAYLLAPNLDDVEDIVNSRDALPSHVRIVTAEEMHAERQRLQQCLDEEQYRTDHPLASRKDLDGGPPKKRQRTGSSKAAGSATSVVPAKRRTRQ